LGTVRPLPADLELSAFRIVQESVTNVVRHAQTPRCLVRLAFGDHELSIEIMDDGRAYGDTSSSGYGLVGMRERATLLNGGFRVAARLPVPA
jgi:signal transduction histidine kinase